jgi:branched-subunit amino acid transport protein
MSNQTLTIWACILLAGLISYVLRVFPVFFQRSDQAPAKVHPFFEYASYALIGGIIATSAFGPRLSELATLTLTWPFARVLLSLLATFAIAVKTKRPVLSLACGMALYAILRFAF